MGGEGGARITLNHFPPPIPERQKLVIVSFVIPHDFTEVMEELKELLETVKYTLIPGDTRC